MINLKEAQLRIQTLDDNLILTDQSREDISCSSGRSLERTVKIYKSSKSQQSYSSIDSARY
jgi:hypothetical protein